MIVEHIIAYRLWLNGPHSNQYSVLCEEDKVHCLHGRDYALSVCRMHPILLQGLLKQMKASKYLISLEPHEYESWLLISFTSVKIMSTIPWWRSVHANVMSLINFTPENVYRNEVRISGFLEFFRYKRTDHKSPTSFCLFALYLVTPQSIMLSLTVQCIHPKLSQHMKVTPSR